MSGVRPRGPDKVTTAEGRADLVFIGDQPISATVNAATQTRITNLNINLTDTEFSHTLVTDLKQLVIRSRDKKEIKISFTATESGTKYITLRAGAVLNIADLNFSGKILYIQSPSTTTIEILELS